jgi:methylated-DNA-[protein]-cysteine S-methyltransferase
MGGLDASAPCAVTQLQLPEATRELTESRIRETSGADPSSVVPPQIAEVIEKVSKHLGGVIQNFRDVPVDLGGAGTFVCKVYDATREIPAGKTATYSDIAHAMGQPTAARAVGQALGRNPIPLIIPCHRVLAAAGKPGGFSAYGGRATKAKLLALEGAVVNLCLDLNTHSGASRAGK